MNLPDINDVIRLLDLKPLVGEGGLWAQTYISPETLDNVFSVYPQIDYEAEIPTETDNIGILK